MDKLITLKEHTAEVWLNKVLKVNKSFRLSFLRLKGIVSNCGVFYYIYFLVASLGEMPALAVGF